MIQLRIARWRSLAAAASLAIPLLAGATSSDAGDDAENAVRAPARVAIKDGAVVLTLSATEQKNAGIAVARPSPASADAVIIGYGRVLDAAGLTDLSNRYLDALSGLQTADAKLAVARAAYQRAQTLHADPQAVSTAQLQELEGRFKVDKTALAAAQFRLSNLAATARQSWGNVLGEALISQTPMVADLVARHDYLVKVTLPAGATIAAAPATATTRLNGGPDIRLDFISPATSTDPRLQGLSYFYKASALSGLLPGFQLAVSLTADTIESGMSVVPEAAIVWLDGKPWVYRRTGATSFERREIAPNRPAPGGGYVVATMPPDAEIVVRGAAMLLSEEFRAQTPIED